LFGAGLDPRATKKVPETARVTKKQEKPHHSGTFWEIIVQILWLE